MFKHNCHFVFDQCHMMFMWFSSTIYKTILQGHKNNAAKFDTTSLSVLCAQLHSLHTVQQLDAQSPNSTTSANGCIASSLSQAAGKLPLKSFIVPVSYVSKSLSFCCGVQWFAPKSPNMFKTNQEMYWIKTEPWHWKTSLVHHLLWHVSFCSFPKKLVLFCYHPNHVVFFLGSLKRTQRCNSDLQHHLLSR